ncbi:MAG: hypothetical protein ACFFCV_18715 [Promethearchaeota archaeon]
MNINQKSVQYLTVQEIACNVYSRTMFKVQRQGVYCCKEKEGFKPR